MNSKWLWSAKEAPTAADARMHRRRGSLLACVASLCAASAAIGATPDWLRAQVAVALPPVEATDNAVILYDETVLTVLSNGNLKRLHRMAYKILRPGGEQLGTLRVHFDSQSRITFMRAWSIPAAGKDYEVKESDAMQTALYGVQNGELVSDLRTKVLRIPAATPGSIIGYEVEQELRPYLRIAEWDFQDTMPVRDVRFTLQLPAGWSYKATWLNYDRQTPVSAGANRWQWALTNLKPVRLEAAMPPWRGIAGRMTVAVIAPDGQDSGMQSWRDIGAWYAGLAKDRRESSPQIKAQVAELTASATTPLQKIQALASFAQSNIRYVAIELGIGGHQPHAAVDVFSNRFGDCKDKSTLLSVMLKDIGIESYYVRINTERGSVGAATPANLHFNHVILAIVLPSGVDDPSLLAQYPHPALGKLLYFDPTNTLTPLGRITGGLQNNYGLLVTPDGGELLPLPKLASTTNSVDRSAQMTLDDRGVLRGAVQDVRRGDSAAIQRSRLNSAMQESQRIRPVETIAAEAFASFEITNASLNNLGATDKPLEWTYTVEAPSYAKAAGDLLLVRPRVLGSKSTGFLETKEARRHAIEFDGPQVDNDVFEITLPAGYSVDELPEPVNVDEGFAAYRSKTEFAGRKLRYTRTFEVKELSVPPEKAERLARLYRIIATDERAVAVLKRSAP